MLLLLTSHFALIHFLGIAIVYAQQDYGSFEWKISPNSTWQKISLTPQLPTKGSALSMILLKPNDKIRFVKNGSISEWNADNALNKASIKFHTWDIADNRTNGPQYINLGNSDVECDRYPLSFCCYPQFLVQIPIGGCDRKAGSTLRNNSCGECTLVENQIFKACNDCNAVIGIDIIRFFHFHPLVNSHVITLVKLQSINALISCFPSR